ncbi:VWA domain-containing protein (plasmid) [Deinococcus taeanensis]|uniref:vWA domain-containing protein n=1 Tax=Deinococcus taeanensis TaxID=2737050 RepID=UPI001CDBEFC4|nr:VWA domain-containing protein [Deinococcus taeanensis]UBV44097.1 VWA domain-containing protein [Deinococcus taeanensis]
MTAPRIEVRPLRPALHAEQTTTLTLLIRIHPAPVAAQAARPDLNIALVIDRSGSMGGRPLHMAREAAVAAVRQARPTDRLSVVAFDDHVDVVVPSQLVGDGEAIIRAIRTIDARGSTNLHGGWLEGATQVATHLTPRALNRVVVLSDGQVNAGVTDTQAIATHVRGLTQRGVSTSAIGLGEHYDEELLLAVANAGDGNFEHVEDAARLPTFFEEELQGLTRTTGRVVSLGLEPNPEFGVTVGEVLNPFERNSFGRLQLPNLVDGQPLDVVVRLHVPRLTRRPGDTVGVTRVRLAWQGLDGQRHRVRTQLDLPVLSEGDLQALPEDPAVLEAQALLDTARLKREAVQAIDRGDHDLARQHFGNARLVAMAAPMPAAALSAQIEDVTLLEEALNAGNTALSRKRAVSQAHAASRSKRRE